MPNLKPGTVVWLKSGGPAMTIKENVDKSYVICGWFNGSKLHESKFSTYQLTTDDPSDPERLNLSILTTDEVKTLSEIIKKAQTKNIKKK